MNDRRTYRLYLAAVSISIALVLIHMVLPENRYRLLPNPNAIIYVHDDSQNGGNSSARFLDASLSRMHCSMRGGTEIPAYCGIGVATSTSAVDWTAGRDFSAYSAIEIKFRYRGPAKKIRISLRNFDEKTSNADDYNSAKYNSVHIRRIDFNTDLHIRLSEFRVSDWWIEQFQLSHKLAHPSFDKVTQLGIEIVSPPNIGEHFIEIEKLDFVGEYVSAENWYLVILSCWLVIILLNALRHMRALYLRAQHDAKRAEEMQAYAEALKHEKNIYKSLSNTDSLTGVLNRLGIMEIVDISCKWQRGDDEIALILIDLDHFKHINENFGRQVADTLLQQVATLLRKNTRSFDSVARWGGDEFLLLCPHTKSDAAMHIAEKIRINISELSFAENEHLRLSASIGIAQIKHGEDFNAVFKRADSALYEAKAEGRDRYVLRGAKLP
ncbi:MAG: GGDEF domain-containing protein [Cellvibrionaceae bacterium]|nr:GGDEF domain-containing protein [Cellvibrionaceae bacterium]